ncbi:DUF6881 domain-containing protein [Streptomyces clavifer]|uniref:DUF6881 domain-containing protein n=1 Tax=Streptomyces clavifer TaxID=68188 RepID=UPI0037B17543
MRHLKVIWHHESPEDPTVIWSEVGDDGYEVRKVEQYVDGRFGLAEDGRSREGSELGEVPVPPLDEIAELEEFTPSEISSAEFQESWIAALKANSLRLPRNPKTQAPAHRAPKVSTRVKIGTRTLKVSKARRGWSVVTVKGRELANLPTKERAVEHARALLQATKKQTTTTEGTSERHKSPHKRT